MVDNMKNIATNQYTLTDILTQAEEYLHPLIQINLESIADMVANVDAELEYFAKLWFDGAPDYLKEIICAVEHARRNGVLDPFMLNDIEYKPNHNYEYISQCTQNLLRRKSSETYNGNCQRLFQFSYQPEGRNMRVILLSKIPIKWIEIPPQRAVSEFSGLVTGENDTVGTETPTNTDHNSKISPVSLPTKSLNPLKEEHGKPLICERCGAVGASAKYKGKVVCPDCLKKEIQEDQSLA